MLAALQGQRPDTSLTEAQGSPNQAVWKERHAAPKSGEQAPPPSTLS